MKSVEQNYPNPFNPTTVIQFSIPHRSFVTLKVYDLSAKKIGTLVSQELHAETFITLWDATGLPSGIYFCQFQAGELVETKKLLLLR